MEKTASAKTKKKFRIQLINLNRDYNSLSSSNYKMAISMMSGHA